MIAHRSEKILWQGRIICDSHVQPILIWGDYTHDHKIATDGLGDWLRWGNICSVTLHITFDFKMIKFDEDGDGKQAILY